MATRTEKDFLGTKEIPEHAYYGVQTLRGKENFNITGIVLNSLGIVTVLKPALG